ncbi:MAG TPA: cellulase family glycosylhydrolase [Mycobacteriales bacterium]|nr:cellulase family glycosylhydrolase [Mycobacteriales bacterium]
MAALTLLGAAIPAAATTARPGPPALGGATFLDVGPAAGPSGLPQIIDGHGRAVLLRAVDVAGLGDYWRPDLKTSYPIDPAAYANGHCPATDPTIEPTPVCRKDTKKIASLGYDAIRLTMSWSLLEPKPGVIDRTYIARIAQVVSWAKADHLWVVLDLHQDAWSKYGYSHDSCPAPLDRTPGFDGAPAWATDTTLPFCTVDNTRELDPGVVSNFQRLWSNVPGPDGVGLQDHLAHVMAVLAARFAKDPTVAGYDLFNEPSPGAVAPIATEVLQLNRYYAKVASAMTAAVPHFRQLLFLEPNVARATTTPAPAEVAPWSAFSSYRRAVYAPHVYTQVFTADAMAGQPGKLQTAQADWDSAVRDAKVLGLPLWVGEFGNGPAQDRVVLDEAFRQQDARGVSGGLWIWKENHNDTAPDQTWSVEGSPREVSASRGYPVALAGRLVSLAEEPLKHTFSMSATAAKGTTVVFLPPAEGGHLIVTGASVRVRTTGAGARVVSLTAKPGTTWRLAVS